MNISDIGINQSKRLSSHNPMLIKSVLFSKGDVCEVGAGLFSTPLLHWLCKSMGRKLVTYENSEQFYIFAHAYQSRLHRIRKVINWDEMDFKKRWGVVFIDHAPSVRRGQDVINFKDTADYIVIHDTESEGYGYEKAWEYFKYRFDWKEFKPFASVVSNFYPLDRFSKNL